jgi:hypothetical protein
MLQNNQTPDLTNNKFILHKKENLANLSLDNFEAESNLDLSLGESLYSNLNTKETNIPNSSISPNIITNPKITQIQPKAQSDLDKNLNTNINNLNTLSNNNNSSNNNINGININLNSLQQNLVNKNNFSLSDPSNFGNLNNKNLKTIKEHHLENETDDIAAESLESKVNKYNLNMNENDIRSKSITNPSYFLNRNDKLLTSSAEKTNQNRIEILVKNNRIETNFDGASNRMSEMATPAMNIDEILAKKNTNNISAYGNVINYIKEPTENKNSFITNGNDINDYNFHNNVALDAPKKPAFENSVNITNTNKINQASNNTSKGNGSSIDDILKKYGIKIDENTAEVLPLNQNSNIASEEKAEPKIETKLKIINSTNITDNLNKNANTDFENIRKSIVKLKETDLASKQKELNEKEQIINNKKNNENLLDELKKEDFLDNKNKYESFIDVNENKIQKSDSFSSKVQKILESCEKKSNISNSNLTDNDNNSDNQRHTSFQLQQDSNKNVVFDLDKQQTDNANNLNLNNNKNFNNPEVRKSCYQPASNINFDDNSVNQKNKNEENEENEDWDSKNKEKLKRNSGIFMKRAKILTTQEKEESKPNRDINPEANRKSTCQEKIVSTYLNELNEEDEQISRIGRNTNITTQNKLNLNSINLNLSTIKDIYNEANEKNNLNNNDELENSKARNSTDVRIIKKNINLNINDINETYEKIADKENDVISPDTAKGKRVSGLMKRPNARDLLLEEKSDEEKDKNKEKDLETKSTAKDNFMKKLNANILKRGNYNDNEDSESNDEVKGKFIFFKKLINLI